MTTVKAIAALPGRHPNAAGAAIAQLATGALEAGAVRLGVHLPTVWAVIIIGFAGPLRLYIGRRGVVGAAREAWAAFLHGSGPA